MTYLDIAYSLHNTYSLSLEVEDIISETRQKVLLNKNAMKMHEMPWGDITAAR